MSCDQANTQAPETASQIYAISTLLVTGVNGDREDWIPRRGYRQQTRCSRHLQHLPQLLKDSTVPHTGATIVSNRILNQFYSI